MNIIKSPNDKSEYSTFQLDNKLKVFVEHNPKISISCVMVIVNVGYMVDKFNGMAHFLEHMLFNGTTKYPEEKFFSDFIVKNGGHTNAFTTHGNTCYYYTIDGDFLEKSLEIFSHFFVSPLLKKDTVNREREAVNSEHEKNINDDDWRFQNVLKRALNKKHPYTKFSTGSNKTLDIPNIHEEIKNLFDSYYSSDLMTLCVVTNNKIDSVKKTITQTFNKITIKKHLSLSKDLNLFESSKIIHVVPVADISKISFYWEIPSFKSVPHKNPTNFICYLIGHEGKNTLYNSLVESGYILSLHCQIYEEIENSSIFFIDVTLVDNKYKDYVVSAVFKYIKLINQSFENNYNHLKNLYDEQQLLNNYLFQFQEQYDSEKKCMQYYETIASCDVSLKYLLVINYLNDDFSNIVQNAKTILNELENGKCVVLYASKIYKNITKTTDENYGTLYSIDNKKIKINLSDIKFMLPTLNKYMSFGKTFVKNTTQDPININGNYLFKTTKFENPNVNIKFKVYLPLTIINKENYTQTLIYFASILLNIGHELYMCETAGYDIDVMFNMGNLDIEIQGNYKKILDVSNFIVDSLINPKFTQEEFERTVYSFTQNDTNLSFEAPYTRVGNYFNKTTLLKYYTNSDRLSSYDKINYKQTINLSKKLFELGSKNLLITGNCDDKLFENILNNFNKLTPRNEYKTNAFLNDVTITNIKNDNIVKIKKENPNEKNNSVGTYLFIANINNFKDDIYNKCVLDVIQKIISQEYFYQLRTQEKFGYIVGSGIVFVSQYKSNNLYFRFIVQSPKKTSNEMINRTKKFITDFENQINNFTKEKFDEIIQACIKVANDPPSNLSNLSDEKMMELQYNLTSFNSKNIIINCYNNLKLNDIKKFYNEKFYSNSKIFVNV